MALCSCDACAGPLEFGSSQAGNVINCPHCGQETVLFISATAGEIPAYLAKQMILSTGSEISGYNIEQYLAIVRGIIVRAPTGNQQFIGDLEQWVGGNIESYAKVCEAAREEAMNRMLVHASSLNADGVIGIRYDTAEFGLTGAMEILVYGTAVKLSRNIV